MTSEARQIAFEKSFAFPLVLYIIMMGTYYPTFGQSPTILDLQRELPYFNDQASAWTITSNFTTDYVSTDCADYPLLGGVTPTSYITSFVRTYENLIPHSTVITTFEISFIDTWPAGVAFTSGYNTSANSILFTGTTWTGNVCGNPSQPDMISKALVTIVRAHSASTLILKLSSSASAQFAIRNVQITLSNGTWTVVKAGLFSSSPLTFNCITALDGVIISTTVSTALCFCPPNQYKPSGGSCSSCHPSCSACFGPSETQCTTCSTGYTYNGTSCIACHESCETCFGTAEGQCYTCPDGHYLYLNSYCGSTCPSSSISQTAGNLYCNINCHSSCATCFGTGENQCSTCPEGHYLYLNSTCSSTCPTAYVQQTTSGGLYCNINCDSSCDTCFGSEANQCSTCFDGYYLYLNLTCGLTCPASYISESSGILFCDYVKCSADNTLHYNENGYYYYFPAQDTCEETCPVPWVVVERLYDRPDCIFPLTQQEIEQIQSFSKKSNTAANVMSGGLVAAAVINPADPNGISSGTLAKQFEYTRYFDVTRSPRLEVFYEEQRSSPGVVDIGPHLSNGSIAKFTYHPLPDIFMKANLHSSFLVNFFDSLESLLIILGGVILVFCIEFSIIKYLKKFAVYFRKLRLAVLAFFVMQFYSVYTDLMFFGTLEFMSFQGGNALDWVSFFLAVIFYIIAFAVLILHFRLIRGYQTCRTTIKDEDRVKNLAEFKEKYDNFEMLYKEFIDLSFFHQSYLFLLTVRASLAGIFMGALHAHPIAQSSLITILGIASIVYMRLMPPFKSIFTAFQQFAYEIVLLLVTLSFLVMACLDANGKNSDESRERLGEIAINSIFASKFLSLITIIPKTIEVTIDVIKTLRHTNRSKRIIRIAPESPSTMNSLVPLTLKKKMMNMLQQVRTPKQANRKVVPFEESPLEGTP